MSRTFAEDIEAEAASPIEAVVIGVFGWGSRSEDDSEAYGIGSRAPIAPDLKGTPLTWEIARPLLDYPYSTGYGAPDCHAVYVWTADRVIWVTQYDGLTSLSSAPRNPSAIVPDMPGG